MLHGRQGTSSLAERLFASKQTFAVKLATVMKPADISAEKFENYRLPVCLLQLHAVDI
jgi:hypothetical protein